MGTLPKISIIIPLYVICDRFFEDLRKFKNLDYPNYEILVIADKSVNITDPSVNVILTGKDRTGPAEKRDIGLKKAEGQICAFIDDDAYPDKGWLRNAVPYFSDKKIVAVGGPGVTPKEDGYWEQISGMVYESLFCSGAAQYRFIPLPGRFVEDYPAYNLLVRTTVLKKVGGYGSSFYGGEDTFLCLKLIKEGKIFYEPTSIIFHHRRPLFMGLLKQIANIGKHRGFFAKKFPQTSRTPMYFLPSILSTGFLIGLSFALLSLSNAIMFGMIIFGFIIVGSLSIRQRVDIKERLLVSIGIILVHLVYGVNFIYGLAFVREMKR